MVPLALGSDTGGSVRQPAALCGIVGVKPSYGRVSRSGLVAFASSLDQVGPFARCVADAETLLGVLSGVDPHDATTVPFERPLARGKGGIRGLKVGIPREMERASEQGDPEVAAAFARAREALRAAGAREVPLSIPAALQAIPVYYLVAPAEASSNLARYDGIRYGTRVAANDLQALYAKTRDAGFGPEVKRRILIGTFALSAGYADAYYKRAMAARGVLRAQFRAAFEQADFLLSATSPFPAFRIGEKSDDPLAMYLCDVLTVAANLAGVPALSLPGGLTAGGLPVGLQVWAAEGREDLMFRAAAGLESALSLPHRRPAWAAAEAP
jgi:aspartyl-tRNA(Asn)/glutamyl-tRNA(Gln) amidotransferase subunit A